MATAALACTLQDGFIHLTKDPGFLLGIGNHFYKVGGRCQGAWGRGARLGVARGPVAPAAPACCPVAAMEGGKCNAPRG